MLNIEKCRTISFTKKRKDTVHYEYSIGDVVPLRVDHIKDLGVVFDVSLNFNLHIDGITCRSIKLCALYGFIKRQTQDFKNVIGLITLFQS